MVNPATHFQQIRQHIRDELAAVIDFDAVCITTIDPATLLSTGSYTDEPIEEIHDQLFQNEFLKRDVHQHEFLATGPIHAASLIQSGAYLNSERYQHILLPNGWSDELRAALVIQGECWGIASLYRQKGKESFQKRDIQAVIDLTPALAAKLRDELFKKETLKMMMRRSSKDFSFFQLITSFFMEMRQGSIGFVHFKPLNKSMTKPSCPARSEH